MSIRKISNNTDFTWVFPLWSITQPRSLLDHTMPTMLPELFDGALSQLSNGLVDLAPLYQAFSRSQEFSAFLAGAHTLVTESRNSDELIDSVARIILLAMMAGWIACEAGIQCRLLGALIREAPNRGLSAADDEMANGGEELQ